MHGAIFMCTGETREECFKYKVFGLPACKENFVRQIRKGMFLFLFDTDNRKMYGVFKAASNGGMNFVPDAYVRITGTSYPAQVRFNVAWKCTPLSEAVFKPAIIDNYFRSNKFQFDLSYRQVGNLLSLFRKRRIMPDPWDDIKSHSSYSSSSNSHSPHKDQFQTSNLKPKHNPDPNPDPNHSNNPDNYSLPYDPDNPGIASSVDYNMQNNYNQDPAKLSCEPCVIKVYASSSSQPLQFFTSNPENCGDASKGSETSNPPTEDNVCNQVPENFYASVLEILQEIPDAPQNPSFVSEHHHSSPLRNIQPQESQNPNPNHAHQNPSFVSEHSSPVRNIQPQETQNPKPKPKANPNNAHQNPSFVSEHHHSSSLRNIQPQETQSPNPNPNPNTNTILYSDTAMRASVFSRLKEREREPGQIDEEPTLDQLLSSLNDKPKKGVNDKGKSSKWVHDKWVNDKVKSTKRDNEKWVHDKWVNDDKWVHDKWVNDKWVHDKWVNDDKWVHDKWVNDDKWVHDKWFNDGKWVHDKKQLSTEIDAREYTVLDEMDMEMDMNELSLDNYEDEEIEPPYVNFKRRNNERKINMIVTEPEEEGSKKKRRFIRPSFQIEGPIRKFDIPSFESKGPIHKFDMLFDEPMKDIETQEKDVEKEVLKEAEIKFEGRTFKIGSGKQNEELQGSICKNGPSESEISKDKLSEPESWIPEDKSEPESGISKDKYKPESCIPKYKSEPESGIPEDKYKPESGIPKDKSEPESENPKPSLASKLRSLIRRKLNEASTSNNQDEVLKKDFIPL